MTKGAPPVDPPEILSGESKAEWDRLARLLSDQGTLAATDRGALAAYCRAWARWSEAEQQIDATGGPVVKSPSGYPIQNPWLAVAGAAFKTMLPLMRELGLTPRTARRCSAEGEPGAANYDLLGFNSAALAKLVEPPASAAKARSAKGAKVKRARKKARAA